MGKLELDTTVKRVHTCIFTHDECHEMFETHKTFAYIFLPRVLRLGKRAAAELSWCQQQNKA
jgi:hypothetical protein